MTPDKITIRLEDLPLHCNGRLAGFSDAIKSAATISGDVLEISFDEWRRIAREHDPRRTRGLGDAVAAVAQPIARAIDGVLGTKVADCKGCKQRQAALNRLVPGL